MTALADVYINRVAAFLPNAPVDNDHMVGDTPSRVRKMILRSNAIKTRHYAIDPTTRETTHTGTELAVAAINGLIAQGMDVNDVSCLACGTSYPDQVMPGHGAWFNPKCTGL